MRVAGRGMTPVPRSPGEGAGSLEGVQPLADIDDRGGIEIGSATSEKPQGAAEPIPLAGVRCGRSAGPGGGRGVDRA